MVRTGVDDPWRPEEEPGRGPEPLDQWLAAGFDKDDAEVWRNWRFRIDMAKGWCHVGVVDGLRAAQWSTAGVAPQNVRDWRDAGIEATEAVSWHEFSFSFEEARRHKVAGRSPNQAFALNKGQHAPMTALSRPFLRATSAAPPAIQRFLAAGADPRVTHSYLLARWTDNEALAWAKQGIDAGEARVWMLLGLQPGEAARLVKRGLSVFETVRQWWRTGIPLEEVGDWIGAGLKPEEAAEQRAKGITAEQAATLRALREDEEQ